MAWPGRFCTAAPAACLLGFRAQPALYVYDDDDERDEMSHSLWEIIFRDNFTSHDDLTQTHALHSPSLSVWEA